MLAERFDNEAVVAIKTTWRGVSDQARSPTEPHSYSDLARHAAARKSRPRNPAGRASAKVAAGFCHVTVHQDLAKWIFVAVSTLG